MLRPRRESLHSDGITDQKSLQRTSETKSAKLGRIGLRFLTPLVALRGIVFLRMLPSSACFGENCDASET
jgi:hypothetical protein